MISVCLIDISIASVSRNNPDTIPINYLNANGKIWNVYILMRLRFAFNVLQIFQDDFEFFYAYT